LRPLRFTALNIAALILTVALASCGGNPAGPASNNQAGGGGNSTNSAVIDNIEQSPWLTCGSCGNAGGVGPAPAYSDMRGIAAPSEDGASTQFSITPSVAFTNAYFYQTHTPVASQFNALTYEFDVYMPAGSEAAPQAIEFECQQVLDGWVYNFAWQAVYPSHVWRLFNYAANNWESAGITFAAFPPGTWHHVMAEYHSDAATHTAVHDALTVDGVRYPVGASHAAVFSGAANNQFTNAIQLDSNLVPTPFSVYVDKMKITYK
jgi:hypothetical protein